MKRGDKVTVFNRNGAGKLIIEGTAELVEPLGNQAGYVHKWKVRFDDDVAEIGLNAELYTRGIELDGLGETPQSDPTAFLANNA